MTLRSSVRIVELSSCIADPTLIFPLHKIYRVVESAKQNYNLAKRESFSHLIAFLIEILAIGAVIRRPSPVGHFDMPIISFETLKIRDL